MLHMKDVVQAITRRGIEIAMWEMTEKVAKRQAAAMMNNYFGQTSGRNDFGKMRAVDGAWRSFRRHHGERNAGVTIYEPRLHRLL